jgi:hypothetical protein
MNRSELITLLQIERGMRIATCYITDSITVTREDIEMQALHGKRMFKPGTDYPKPYHYKIPPGLHVEEGDMVALPVRDREIVIGRVHAIHTDIPDGVDLSQNRYNLRYIMDVIRPDLHDMAVAEENAAMTQVRQAEVRRKLTEFQQSAGIDLDTIKLPSLAAPTPETADASDLIDTETPD